MKKIFGPLGAGAGAILLVVANLTSYISGLFRDFIFTKYYGISYETDMYSIAMKWQEFLFDILFLGFVMGALLPVFLSAEQKSKEKGEELFQSFLTFFGGVTIIVTAIIFFFLPQVIDMFYSSRIYEGKIIMRPPEEKEMFLHIFQIVLFSPFITGISFTLGTILMARKKFFSYAFSPALNNVGIILGIFFLTPFFGIYGASFGAILGAFFHLLPRLFDFFTLNISFRPLWKISSEMKEIFFLGIPKTIGVSFLPLTFLIFGILAPAIEEGAITALDLARNFQSFSVSLFGIAFATAAFPFLSELANRKQKEDFQNRFSKSFFQILFFSLPATIGMFFLSDVIVSFFLDLSQKQAQLTTIFLIWITFTIPFESLNHLLSRSIMAHKNTLFPAFGKFLFFSVSVSLAIFLIPSLGALAFALAFSFGIFSEFLFLGWALFRYTSLSFSKIFPSLAKILFLSGLMGIFLWVFFDFLLLFSLSPFLFALFKILGAMFFGGILYLSGGMFLRISEISEVFFFREKFFLLFQKVSSLLFFFSLSLLALLLGIFLISMFYMKPL